MSIKTYSRSKDGNTQLTPNFKVIEFASKCGSDEIKIDSRLPQVLQRIREIAGNKPVTIDSGYRTPAHNKAVGGVPDSLHTKGQAASIIIKGMTLTDIARCAETALAEMRIPGGICVYNSFTTVDVRPKKWRAVNNGSAFTKNNGWSPMPRTNT